jgi:hypothetical protein
MKLSITNKTSGIAVETVTKQVLQLSGRVGPPGPPGSVPTIIAAEAIGGHRAITVSGFHCEPATANELAGISSGAASIGNSISYVVQGLMTEGSWSWTAGLPIYLSALGVLTHTPPVSGVQRVIGWAISATEINVDFAPTITLA